MNKSSAERIIIPKLKRLHEYWHERGGLQIEYDGFGYFPVDVGYWINSFEPDSGGERWDFYEWSAVMEICNFLWAELKK